MLGLPYWRRQPLLLHQHLPPRRERRRRLPRPAGRVPGRSLLVRTMTARLLEYCGCAKCRAAEERLEREREWERVAPTYTVAGYSRTALPAQYRFADNSESAMRY